MKVLGILGGANKDGNTAKLVEEVLAGARDAGHETVLIKLVDEKIGHIGYRNGEATFPKDDFEVIKPHIETMGALVIGAPIWYSTVDSRTHAFIQRLYYYSSYYSEENRKRWPKGVKAVNIITYAQSDPHYYDQVLDVAQGDREGLRHEGHQGDSRRGHGGEDPSRPVRTSSRRRMT